jgi:hypothetical protein
MRFQADESGNVPDGGPTSQAATDPDQGYRMP